MAGCVASLYDSVERLDAAYVRSADARAELLAPAGGYESGKLLQLQATAAPAAVEVYTGDCYSYVAAVRGTSCRRCRSAMNVPIELVGCSGMGFMKEVMMYKVMDDLQVAPMFTISSIAALNALGITDISSVQENDVVQGLEILRALLQSKTALTDIFRGSQTSYFWRGEGRRVPAGARRRLARAGDGPRRRRAPGWRKAASALEMPRTAAFPATRITDDQEAYRGVQKFKTHRVSSELVGDEEEHGGAGCRRGHHVRGGNLAFLADSAAKTRNQEEHGDEDDEAIPFWYFVALGSEIFGGSPWRSMAAVLELSGRRRRTFPARDKANQWVGSVEDLVRLLWAKEIEVLWEGFFGFEKGAVELGSVPMVGVELWMHRRRGSRERRTGARWGVDRGGRGAAKGGRN
ncbi:hypothetical protein C2845_PM05G32110 [Panicum miliaceum]|uniref:Uncharacterized protein n=1 Tax=Panicum miliaceum TaxID=4540 RepID=A0A3L6T2N2_PANMI|nr:hypothetical protein C2845_PM05G32110 [Panicum miliaceum]